MNKLIWKLSDEKWIQQFVCLFVCSLFEFITQPKITLFYLFGHVIFVVISNFKKKVSVNFLFFYHHFSSPIKIHHIVNDWRKKDKRMREREENRYRNNQSIINQSIHHHHQSQQQQQSIKINFEKKTSVLISKIQFIFPFIHFDDQDDNVQYGGERILTLLSCELISRKVENGNWKKNIQF